MEPTSLQKDIIDQVGNVVVLAAPGSGKTFVMSEKIVKVLSNDNILEYQGVIALSFTRQASKNLKDRVVSRGVFCKGTFFGTIDNFCLTQIILPFAEYIFGYPDKEPDIILYKQLNQTQKNALPWLEKEQPNMSEFKECHWTIFSDLFKDGIIVMESLGLLSVHILETCVSCQRYIKARYRQVFIDEFQDSDYYTNELFALLIKLGLCGIAVGDPNQSIFGFSHKDSRYLKSLTVNPDFHTFTLNQNFRCAISIINYSNRLMNSQSNIIATNEKGMYLIRVNGDESRICNLLDDFIPRVCKHYGIKPCDVAILSRIKFNQQLINAGLQIPHVLSETTDLDTDINIRSLLYAELLRYRLNAKMTFVEVIEEFVEYSSLNDKERKLLNTIKNQLRLTDCVNDMHRYVDLCEQIGDIVLLGSSQKGPRILLKQILADRTLLDSYKPSNENEVVLMTLHKSKGLEFEVVFNLNLNEWQLPLKHVVNNDFDHPIYDWQQELDLHYVGITRAKKCCFLIMSTLRTNKNGKTIKGVDSEFLSINNLNTLRKDCTY